MESFELVLVLGTTWLACRSILRKHAVDLLRGPEPPSAKERFYEKWDLWDGLPLFIQTIVNNCVNDKRRVLSTIVGVAGCTALIVTAITLNNDVMKSYDAHYANVYGFDTIASGDSFNDLGMIQASRAGFLFRTTDQIKKDYPQYPAFEEYADLLNAVKAEIAKG